MTQTLKLQDLAWIGKICIIKEPKMLTTGEKRYESRKDIKEKHLVKLSSK